ncbi:MAG: cupredoxin domain-containing protein [Acidobacteriota bacterium]
MRISRIFVPAAAGLVLVSLLLSAQTPAPRQITVTAKKYEFQPSRIELKVGEPVEINFESEDTKHGFVCKDLNLEKVVFDKGAPTKVTFTPDKAGTFEFKCAKFCGMGHSKMKGEFVVSAP